MDVHNAYNQTVPTVLPLLRKLIDAGYRMWIYRYWLQTHRRLHLVNEPLTKCWKLWSCNMGQRWHRWTCDDSGDEAEHQQDESLREGVGQVGWLEEVVLWGSGGRVDGGVHGGVDVHHCPRGRAHGAGFLSWPRTRSHLQLLEGGAYALQRYPKQRHNALKSCVSVDDKPRRDCRNIRRDSSNVVSFVQTFEWCKVQKNSGSSSFRSVPCRTCLTSLISFLPA